MPFGLPSAYGAGALTNVFALPSNNLFKGTGFYNIGFTTATTGTIKTIEITFPAGFNVAGAKLIQSVGMGAGSISISGQVVKYTITTAVSVTAPKAMMIMIGNVVNPAITSNQLSVTTRDTAAGIIDGPTNSATFTLTQVTSSMIAGSSITTTKILDGQVMNSDLASNSVDSAKISDATITSADTSPSFMKFVQLLDNSAGHGVGWDPNGILRVFMINDTDVTSQSNILLTLITPFGGSDSNCGVDSMKEAQFRVYCDSSSVPPNGSYLNYIMITKQHPLTQAATIVLSASSKTTDAFTPYPIIIKLGDTVTWKNEDTTPHTVTSGTGPSDPNKGIAFDSSPGLSPLINPGNSYSHTFSQTGLYQYFCQLHPNMIGQVGVDP